MTLLLLFSGYRHGINNVMITRYITLSAVTSNIMTMSVTAILFLKINFEVDKITFKRSYDKQYLTRVITSYQIYYRAGNFFQSPLVP